MPTRVFCANGHPLKERPDIPQEKRKACRICGSTARAFETYGNATIRLSAKAAYERIREFWEYNPLLVAVLAALTLGAPFIGLAIAGWPGVLIGLLVGVTSAVIGAKAVVRVRETTGSGT